MSGKTASTAGRGADERAAADDFVIAVDLVGWRRLVPRSPALASERFVSVSRRAKRRLVRSLEQREKHLHCFPRPNPAVRVLVGQNKLLGVR